MEEYSFHDQLQKINREIFIDKGKQVTAVLSESNVNQTLRNYKKEFMFHNDFHSYADRTRFGCTQLQLPDLEKVLVDKSIENEQKFCTFISPKPLIVNIMDKKWLIAEGKIPISNSNFKTGSMDTYYSENISNKNKDISDASSHLVKKCKKENIVEENQTQLKKITFDLNALKDKKNTNDETFYSDKMSDIDEAKLLNVDNNFDIGFSDSCRKEARNYIYPTIANSKNVGIKKKIVSGRLNENYKLLSLKRKYPKNRLFKY